MYVVAMSPGQGRNGKFCVIANKPISRTAGVLVYIVDWYKTLNEPVNWVTRAVCWLKWV